jgi:hypothetical protein
VGHRKYDVKIPAGNKPSFEFVNPLFLFQKLTFRTMPVVTGVVCLLFILAMGAGIDMSAQLGSTATGNVGESFLLLVTELFAVQEIF